MKLYTIAFTKKGAALQKHIEEALYNIGCSTYAVQKFLSVRIYDELIGENPSRIGRASLADFCQKAWSEADAMLFIGATGIAVRGIAPHVTAKDKDPAVLVMDELGQFVIPLLSGHIGGANELASILSNELGSTLVLTTATDINHKPAIDSWAVKNGYEIADTRGIAPVSSAILEDKEVLLISEQKDLEALKKEYLHFIPYRIADNHDVACFYEEPCKESICKEQERAVSLLEDMTEENRSKQAIYKNVIHDGEWEVFPQDENRTKKALQKLEQSLDEIIEKNRAEKRELPMVVISPLAIQPRENLLHIVPKKYFVGMGARRDKDSEEFISFYHRMLEESGIHPRAIVSVSSIDIKAEERCFHELAKYEREYTKLELEFYTAEILATAERYTSHEFVQSELVNAVTGVNNVCERAAVLSAVRNRQKKEMQTRMQPSKITVQILVPKTKKNGMTFALASRR